MKEEFAKFKARDYLLEYYGDVSGENGRLIEGLVDLRKSLALKGPSRFCDVGCGGSVYAGLVFSDLLRDAVFFDFSRASCEEVSRWVSHPATAFDWSKFAEFISIRLNACGIDCSAEGLQGHLRSVTRGAEIADITLPQPLRWRDQPVQCDLLYSAFCIEHCSDSLTQFSDYVGHLGAHISRGGRLILVSLIGGKGIDVSGDWHAVQRLSEPDVIEAVKRASLEVDYTMTLDVDAQRKELEYQQFLITSATVPQ